jgi:hypothetical protein
MDMTRNCSVADSTAARGKGFLANRLSFTVPSDRYMKHALYRGADKSLARPGRKQATATEDFEINISYL